MIDSGKPIFPVPRKQPFGLRTRSSSADTQFPEASSIPASSKRILTSHRPLGSALDRFLEGLPSRITLARKALGDRLEVGKVSPIIRSQLLFERASPVAGRPGHTALLHRFDHLGREAGGCRCERPPFRIGQRPLRRAIGRQAAQTPPARYAAIASQAAPINPRSWSEFTTQPPLKVFFDRMLCELPSRPRRPHRSPSVWGDEEQACMPPAWMITKTNSFRKPRFVWK